MRADDGVTPPSHTKHTPHAAEETRPPTSIHQSIYMFHPIRMWRFFVHMAGFIHSPVPQCPLFHNQFSLAYHIYSLSNCVCNVEYSYLPLTPVQRSMLMHFRYTDDLAICICVLNHMKPFAIARPNELVRGRFPNELIQAAKGQSSCTAPT